LWTLPSRSIPFRADVHIRGYVSDLKWLFLSLHILPHKVENWREVIAYYLMPVHSTPLVLRFRNGDVLNVPASYSFEAIAETILMNVYKLSEPASVVIDIGASVGDFTILASQPKSNLRIYSYEPDPETFDYMKSNVSLNGRNSVRLFNEAANSDTLHEVLHRFREPRIDFLKIDCEGCEYEVLMKCSIEDLSVVQRISMEIHECEGCYQSELISFLRRAGFNVTWERKPGHGQYVYAKRKL